MSARTKRALRVEAEEVLLKGAIVAVIKERDFELLEKIAEIVESDIDPDMAATDPSRYMSLRKAVNQFHLKGFTHMTVERVRKIRSKYTISDDDPFFEGIDYDDISGSAEAIFGSSTYRAWGHLVADLFERIKDRSDKNNRPYPKIIQIKVKFGELRIYARTDDETINRWISTTIQQADHSCSQCSNAATMQIFDGLYLIMCCSCAHSMASERHPERRRLFGHRKYPIHDNSTCSVCGYRGQIDRADDRGRCPVCVKKDW